MSIIFEDILGATRSQSPDDFSSPCSPQSSRDTTPTSSPPPSYSGSVDGTTIKTESDKTETKPVKKRKSWGQQLPTPTTNLPPRKRAKTAEEKEQRRVERVLRNRAAAQKSREVKKQQLEAIEQERDVLKRENEVLAAENSHFQSIVSQMQDRFQQMQEENRRLRLTSGSPEQEQQHQPLMDDKPLDEFVFDTNYGLDPTSLFSATGTSQNEPESPCMTHQPAVSAGETDYGNIFDIDGMYLDGSLDCLSDGDSGLPSSPESSSALSPERLLDEFLDCERGASLAHDESDLLHGFGASTDRDGL